MEMATRRTRKPMVVGILSMVAGLFSLLGGIFVVILIFAVRSEQLFSGFFTDLFPTELHGFVQVVWAMSAFWCVVAVVMELLGGICAFKRQKWVLTLIGSCIAVLVMFPLGIPAVILTVLSQNEFK